MIAPPGRDIDLVARYRLRDDTGWRHGHAFEVIDIIDVGVPTGVRADSLEMDQLFGGAEEFMIFKLVDEGDTERIGLR